MSHLHQRIRRVLARATELAVADGVLPAAVDAPDVPIDRPKQAEHGDLATNLAFVLAKAAKGNPRQLAERLVPLIRRADDAGWIEAIEVAGPGFLNLRLSGPGWHSALTDVIEQGDRYGHVDAGRGASVLLEFVSANPTGPMHVGHGRGAVLGDTLVRVLRAAGYQVAAEYYINNVGNQVAKLGESVWAWMRDPMRRAAALATWGTGEPVPFPDGFPTAFPADGYRGAYVAETAEELAAAGGFAAHVAASPVWTDDAAWGALEAANPSGRADHRAVTVQAWQAMLACIRADLDALDIRFDRFFSERSLHGLDAGTVDAIGACCGRLAAADWAYRGDPGKTEYDTDDAPTAIAPIVAQPLLFRGTREDIPKAIRDGKDRVILRGDGRPTYFAADIAYHEDKMARGFDQLVDVLGADHHGYVSRLKGIVHVLGALRSHEGDASGQRWQDQGLEVLLVQMVALLRDGKPVQMGKRSGEFVTLRDVIDEVTTGAPGSGRDAVRFTFLTRKADAQLDFDLEVARRTSMDNPVYYVQYGHARLASVLERAATAGKALRPGASLDALRLDDERALAMAVAELPEVVARAARNREPHLVAYWLLETCRAFHGYYSRGKTDARLITDDDATTQARLTLVTALRQAISNALALLGVTAPDHMAELPDAEPAH
ncbi:MAG: arginine--tRNA ligase [Myxococcales bacterium]|nr:arginine--tRNA ligase [Myxococcales bacterium]